MSTKNNNHIDPPYDEHVYAKATEYFNAKMEASEGFDMQHPWRMHFNAGYKSGFSGKSELLEMLKVVSPIIDKHIDRTPSGLKRNELCDLNIKIKSAIAIK